ncbi:MAG: hypothetical protein K0A93_03430 [Desulfuromonadaceae bacterium]|nr:hypothetical protein [Desulfuromonadaceae bacterium]
MESQPLTEIQRRRTFGIISHPDPKRLAAFEKANQANLAHDAEGNLTYLASSEWRLGFVTEQWPEIIFLKTREHD